MSSYRLSVLAVFLVSYCVGFAFSIFPFLCHGYSSPLGYVLYPRFFSHFPVSVSISQLISCDVLQNFYYSKQSCWSVIRPCFGSMCQYGCYAYLAYSHLCLRTHVFFIKNQSSAMRLFFVNWYLTSFARFSSLFNAYIPSCYW